MLGAQSTGYAFNRTRQTYLATNLSVAATHWSRFRGLMCQDVANFRHGQGLWIVPCRGVHTMAMSFPIDVVYLDAEKHVVHVAENMRPWRMGRVSLKATSVLELPGETLKSTGTMIGDAIEIGQGDAAKA
jgi:uncharacterized membrane protein (UPF0127 family)